MGQSPHIEHGGVTADFAQAMVALAACYPSFTLREDTVRMYASQLADISPPAAKDAMAAAARRCRFFPTVAEVRAAHFGSEEDTALLAWATAERAVQEVAGGAHGSVEFEDGAIAGAITQACGSWPEFCALDEGPSLGIKRQEFLAAYRRLRRVGQTEPTRLWGRLEATGHLGTTPGVVWLTHVAADGTIAAREGLPPAPQARALPEAT